MFALHNIFFNLNSHAISWKVESCVMQMTKEKEKEKLVFTDHKKLIHH